MPRPSLNLISVINQSTRQELLKLLVSAPFMNVDQILEISTRSLQRSTFKKHLDLLEKFGLVTCQRDTVDGKNVYMITELGLSAYSIRDELAKGFESFPDPPLANQKEDALKFPLRFKILTFLTSGSKTKNQIYEMFSGPPSKRTIRGHLRLLLKHNLIACHLKITFDDDLCEIYMVTGHGLDRFSSMSNHVSQNNHNGSKK